MPLATPVLEAVQAWQRPEQAVAQQTLSRQEKAHSPGDVHALPGDKKANSSALASSPLLYPPATRTVPLESTLAVW